MISRPAVDASTAFGYAGNVYVCSVVSFDSTANTAVVSCSKFIDQQTVTNYSTLATLTAGQSVLVIGDWSGEAYIFGAL